MNLAYQAIRQLDVPDDFQEIHQELLEDFLRLRVVQLNDIVRDIIDENEDYGKALAEIMKMLENSPVITHDTAQDQYLKDFEGDFRQYKAFMMAKEAL